MVPNVKRWWSKLTTVSGAPAVEVPPGGTQDAELPYWWLLPGDVTCSPTPSTRNPEANAE